MIVTRISTADEQQKAPISVVYLPAKQVPVSRDGQVFVGGVSDGRLQRGDVITAIQHYDATRIAHRQAEDIIRAAGDTLSISVKRLVGQFKVGHRSGPSMGRVGSGRVGPQNSSSWVGRVRYQKSYRHQSHC